MKILHAEPHRIRIGISVATVLVMLLVGAGSPVVAQTGVDEQIQALQHALDQIKASARASMNIQAQLGLILAVVAVVVSRRNTLTEDRDRVVAATRDGYLPVMIAARVGEQMGVA